MFLQRTCPWNAVEIWKQTETATYSRCRCFLLQWRPSNCRKKVPAVVLVESCIGRFHIISYAGVLIRNSSKNLFGDISRNSFKNSFKYFFNNSHGISWRLIREISPHVSPGFRPGISDNFGYMSSLEQNKIKLSFSFKLWIFWKLHAPSGKISESLSMNASYESAVALRSKSVAYRIERFPCNQR